MPVTVRCAICGPTPRSTCSPRPRPSARPTSTCARTGRRAGRSSSRCSAARAAATAPRAIGQRTRGARAPCRLDRLPGRPRERADAGTRAARSSAPRSSPRPAEPGRRPPALHRRPPGRATTAVRPSRRGSAGTGQPRCSRPRSSGVTSRREPRRARRPADILRRAGATTRRSPPSSGEATSADDEEPTQAATVLGYIRELAEAGDEEAHSVAEAFAGGE